MRSVILPIQWLEFVCVVCLCNLFLFDLVTVETDMVVLNDIYMYIFGHFYPKKATCLQSKLMVLVLHNLVKQLLECGVARYQT